MPIARVQLPDGRIARFDVPRGTSAADIEATALQFAGGGIDPNTSKHDDNLEAIDRLMSCVTYARPASALPSTVTLHLGLVRFKVDGAALDVVRAASNVRGETSAPIIGATVASLAFPPAAPVVGRTMLANLATRFAPNLLGTGT